MKTIACMVYFARCINIIFNSLLVQLVKYDVHTTRKIQFIHAIFSHIIIICTTHTYIQSYMPRQDCLLI